MLLPPNDSFSNLVNLESLYGMWDEFLLKLLITLPSIVKDKLIFLASSNASPFAWLLEILSDPAKSTKFKIPLFSESFGSFYRISIIQIECDLDEFLFNLVLDICLNFSPVHNTASISSSEIILTSVNP